MEQAGALDPLARWSHPSGISPLFWIHPRDSDSGFPDPEEALEEPNGLLAVGGNLTPKRLLAAYKAGIFPWYSDNQPILWWSPEPREVLFPGALHLSRSLRKRLRRGTYRVTLDRAFRQVLDGCSAPRPDEPGTWITTAMKQAYERLHRAGHSHSVEAWLGDELAGGLYGVAIGRIFCGESMFARRDDASKVAFVHLVRQLERWGFALIDCQLRTEHLRRFGSVGIPRREYLELLEEHGSAQTLAPPSPWSLQAEVSEALEGGRA